MKRQVLILGGTGEARRLAEALAGDPEFEVVSSLAGRVRDPALPDGVVRVGGFGGSDGLTGYLREHRVVAVVDATHPFAVVMTASAVTATGRLGVPLLVLHRPGWTPVDGDDWHWVPTLEDAARALSRFGERVFLTTGRTGLVTFAGLDQHWFLVRSIDPPSPPAPRRMTVLLDRGPFTVEAERALLVEHRIDVLVTKDSGGEMTEAKLQAAREEGVPVLIQARPATPSVDTESTVAGALRWLAALA